MWMNVYSILIGHQSKITPTAQLGGQLDLLGLQTEDKGGITEYEGLLNSYTVSKFHPTRF